MGGGAVHRVAQAQRLVLHDEDDLVFALVQAGGLERAGHAVLALRPQHPRQVGVVAHVTLDRRLRRVAHEHHALDPRGAGFVAGVLDQGCVDDRQQFLWRRLGGGQEPGAQACDGENCCADGIVFHRRSFLSTGPAGGAVVEKTRWDRSGRPIPARSKSTPVRGRNRPVFRCLGPDFSVKYGENPVRRPPGRLRPEARTRGAAIGRSSIAAAGLRTLPAERAPGAASHKAPLCFAPADH